MTVVPHDSELGLLDVAEDGRRVVLEDGPESAVPVTWPALRQVLGAMGTVVTAVALTYAVPALAPARPWSPDDPVPFWNVIGRELLGEGVAAEVAHAGAEAAVAEARAIAETEPEVAPPPDKPVRAKSDALPPYEAHKDDSAKVQRSVELPHPRALDPFFAALARSDHGYEGAVTRVVHYGDSVIGNDNISSSARDLMQARFGDAGHGFHLLAQPNSSYRHKGIDFRTNDRWKRCYIIKQCRSDGHYGLGATTFNSYGGASSTFGTTTEGFGQKLSRVKLWYAAQPKGGRISIAADDQEPVVLETAADALEDRWHTVELADGPHAIEVRAEGGGKVRAYGVTLERDVPGVVWDGMAQVGAFTRKLLQFDAQHLEAQMQAREANLVVLTFGGNDLLGLAKGRSVRSYKEQLREVLRHLRRGRYPEACLVMAPVDHGVRRGARILTVDELPALVTAQREVALEEGCGFFDTWSAMGGDGSAGRWRRTKPPLISGDLAHLTHAGQKLIGRWLYLALMERYREYRERTAGQ